MTTYIHGCKQTPPTPPTTSDEESSGSSDDADMKKKKGNRAMGKKKYPKALKYYSRAIKIDPECATYHLNRAIANAALELWKDAEVDAQNAVVCGEPPSAKSHYQLARARLRRGRCEEASEAVKAGLAAYPGETALVQLRGEVERACSQLRAKQRRQEEAEAARPPSTAGPSGFRPALDQARAAYSAGRLEEACEMLREATANAGDTDPGTGEDLRRERISALSLLGKANMQLRRWQDAASAFERLVELEEATFSLDKRDEREALSSAYNNLGIARKSGGDLPGAVEAMNTAYQRATNGDDKVATGPAAQILQNAGQALRAQKKPGEALKFYVRALDIGLRIFGPDHASQGLNHLCIARCHRDQGDVMEAIKAYTKAIELWSGKTLETCLAEMPEVPNRARFEEVQGQCRQELAQLLQAVEQLRRQQASEQAPAAASG